VPGKFVIKKAGTGKFRFALTSPRGQVIATSGAYEAKASAMAGIRAMRKLAADATVEDQTRPPAAKPKAAAKASAPASRRRGARTKSPGAASGEVVPSGQSGQ
jgi:uncharacterized protein YegP (UPF0339 family)